MRERAAAVAGEVAAVAAGPDGLALVVLGVPRALDGAAHRQTERVLAFADALRAVIGVPLVLQDERLTSVEAESRLAVRERDWRKRKARLDAAAAAVILQGLSGLEARRPAAGCRRWVMGMPARRRRRMLKRLSMALARPAPPGSRGGRVRLAGAADPASRRRIRG